MSVADEADQARYVVEKVLEAREAGMTLKSQAVLFRAAHHSAALEIELTRRNIPFVKFGGLKFLDSVHVKDVLAVLRWAENPRDRVAGFRVVQLLPGIGPAIAGRVLDQVSTRRHAARAGVVRRAAARERGLAAVRRADGEGLRARTGWPAEFEMIRRWYEPHLERNHEDAAIRHGDVLQMESIASTYPTRERSSPN